MHIKNTKELLKIIGKHKPIDDLHKEWLSALVNKLTINISNIIDNTDQIVVYVYRQISDVNPLFIHDYVDVRNYIVNLIARSEKPTVETINKIDDAVRSKLKVTLIRNITTNEDYLKMLVTTGIGVLRTIPKSDTVEDNAIVLTEDDVAAANIVNLLVSLRAGYTIEDFIATIIPDGAEKVKFTNIVTEEDLLQLEEDYGY